MFIKFSNHVSLGMALSVSGNTEGGTKYQVGSHKSPTSRVEVVSLCIMRLTLSLMEHKPRRVGPTSTHSLRVRLLKYVPSGEKPGISRSTLKGK